MATTVKIVTARDFLVVTPEGIIDLETSRKLLVDIAKAKAPPADYDLLLDLRDTKWEMSSADIYEIASELYEHGDTFRRSVAVLVQPGVDFDAATFLETCSHNRGYLVDAFNDFESAVRWLLHAEGPGDPTETASKAAGGAES